MTHYCKCNKDPKLEDLIPTPPFDGVFLKWYAELGKWLGGPPFDERASETPTLGGIPLSDAEGKIDAGWLPDTIPTTESVNTAINTALEGTTGKGFWDVDDELDPYEGSYYLLMTKLGVGETKTAGTHALDNGSIQKWGKGNLRITVSSDTTTDFTLPSPTFGQGNETVPIQPTIRLPTNGSGYWRVLSNNQIYTAALFGVMNGRVRLRADPYYPLKIELSGDPNVYIELKPTGISMWLPTDPTGLPVGTLYNDGGTVKVVI